MTAPDEMTVYKHRDCDNHVAYQNIPISRPDVDRSDGRQWEPTNYTRTDIHQAALDRIAELEGELAFYADQSKWRDCGFDCSEPGVMSLVHSSIQKDHGKRAIAVLAKGDG